MNKKKKWQTLWIPQPYFKLKNPCKKDTEKKSHNFSFENFAENKSFGSEGKCTENPV